MHRLNIIKNISWLFFDQILRITGGVFIGIWVARYLGPADFGSLNYAIAYTALFTLFSKLGLDQIVVREIVRNPDQTSQLLGTAFTFKLAGALTAIAAINISFIFNPTESLTRILIIIIALQFIFQSLDVIDYYYQAKALSKYAVIARNIGFIISFLLKISFIVLHYPVIFFAVALIVEIAISGSSLLVVYLKLTREKHQWHFCGQTAKKYIRCCWPLAASMFLITVNMKIDQVMIGNILSKAHVGMYSIAVLLAEAWYFIPSVMITALMPYFVELRESNKSLYHMRLMQLYSIMFWLGTIIGIFILLFGQEIVTKLFGSHYSGAYEALVINIWNGIFISQAMARGIWLINEDLQQYRLYTNMIIVILNITMNYTLIPIWGITGSAIATVTTQLSGTWIIALLLKPLRPSTIAMIYSINPIFLFKIKYEPHEIFKKTK